MIALPDRLIDHLMRAAAVVDDFIMWKLAQEQRSEARRVRARRARRRRIAARRVRWSRLVGRGR